MKITTEQISALQESEVRKGQKVAENGFDALLSEHIGSEKNQATSFMGDASSIMRQNTVPLFSLEAGAITALGTSEENSEKDFADPMAMRMENLFSGMDDYAKMLSSNDPKALRNAYSVLENMTEELASFRSAYPNMEAEQPEIASLFNEFEVLALTENFKFNRGDYL